MPYLHCIVGPALSCPGNPARRSHAVRAVMEGSNWTPSSRISPVQRANRSRRYLPIVDVSCMHGLFTYHEQQHPRLEPHLPLPFVNNVPDP